MKKSICYVVTQGELGGAQKYVFELATNFAKNYDITVLVGKEKPELANQLRGAGIKVILLDHLKRDIHPVHDFFAVFELKKFFQSLRPDLIHLNSSKAGVLGSLAARLAGIRNVVFTAHGFAFLEPHNWLVKKIYFWAEKFSTRFRRKIITVSEFDRRAAIKARLCPPEKLVTIHNGIDLSVIASPRGADEAISGLRRRFAPRNDNIVIGTIAHLYPTKGIKYLIEAAHIFNSKFEIRNSKFIVIGEGHERNQLEATIRDYGLEKDFFLVGALPNASQYLQAFDIFVLPSIKEGFPYAILEAAAAGLPIIATAVGGIPEIIANSKQGLLVEPKHPEALAEALAKLLRDPEYIKTLGRSARERVSEFTLDGMLSLTLKCYETILL